MNYQNYRNGCIGGWTGLILSYPCDTIKSHYQITKSNNMIKCSVNLVKKNGFSCLFKGIKAPFFGVSFKKSLVFGTYEFANTKLKNNFMSGVIAGVVCSSIVTPVEYIKINQQVNQKINLNDMYKGFRPTLVIEGLGFGIYFSSYYFMKQEHDSLFSCFIKGGLSGGFSCIFIYPVDLIKSNIQAGLYNNEFGFIKHRYNEQGLSSFYKGFSLALLRAIPLHAGVCLGYECAKKYL